MRAVNHPECKKLQVPKKIRDMERNYPRFRPITKFKLISFENILYSYRIDFYENLIFLFLFIVLPLKTFAELRLISQGEILNQYP